MLQMLFKMFIFLLRKEFSYYFAGRHLKTLDTASCLAVHMSYQYKSRTILQFANIPRRRTTLLIGLGHGIILNDIVISNHNDIIVQYVMN